MTQSATRLQNTVSSYGSVTKTFHWLTALLILTAIPLGLIANDWPFDTVEALETKFTLFSLHKTIGVTTFFVALARIAWAFGQTRPAPLHPARKMETWLGETVHWLLYASLVIVPLSGWLHHAATTGFAPIWWPFGQHLPLVPISEPVSLFFSSWHYVFTRVLIVSLILHIAGAVKHLVIDRDATLARMLPGQTMAGQAGPSGHGASIAAAAVIYLAAIGLGSFWGIPAAAPQQSINSATAPSAWSVEDGTLAITVSQMGKHIEGQFKVWNAAIAFDPDADGAVLGRVSVDIDITSVQLGQVTQQALGPDYFATADFPAARFNAEITRDPTSDTTYIAEGTLSLKGAEVPLTLPFTLVLDGNSATMNGATTLDRRDFSVGPSSDEKLVGFVVAITVSLEATRAAPS